MTSGSTDRVKEASFNHTTLTLKAANHNGATLVASTRTAATFGIQPVVTALTEKSITDTKAGEWRRNMGIISGLVVIMCITLQSNRQQHSQIPVQLSSSCDLLVVRVTKMRWNPLLFILMLIALVVDAISPTKCTTLLVWIAHRPQMHLSTVRLHI
ncbi:hypothetical protein TcWFU_005777 [Taenia crassiceps]|uniref:Uncharacterized protein n=1 Tax=Taenia crassiceps TaxID=6207 RepID=A0ABR4QLB4_9CEST